VKYLRHEWRAVNDGAFLPHGGVQRGTATDTFPTCNERLGRCATTSLVQRAQLYVKQASPIAGNLRLAIRVDIACVRMGDRCARAHSDGSIDYHAHGGLLHLRDAGKINRGLAENPQARSFFWGEFSLLLVVGAWFPLAQARSAATRSLETL